MFKPYFGVLLVFLLSFSLTTTAQEKTEKEKMEDQSLDPESITDEGNVESAAEVVEIIEEVIKIDYSADNSSPEAVIKGFYESISGPVNEKRDLNRIYNLFTSNARILPGFWYGKSHLTNVTINPLIFYMEMREVFEASGLNIEVTNTTVEEFGLMAHAVVTSKVSWDPATENESLRSIASVQMIKSYEGKWQIIQLMFQDEIEDFKIPKKYLPK